MKYLLYCLFALAVLVHYQAEAQCFSNNIKQGKAQMAKGDYQGAKAIFLRALKCPDSQKAEANKYIQECNAKIQQITAEKQRKLKERQEKEAEARKQKALLEEQRKQKEKLAQLEEERLRSEQEAARRREQEQRQRLLAEERERKAQQKTDSLRRVKEEEERQRNEYLALSSSPQINTPIPIEGVTDGEDTQPKAKQSKATKPERKNPFFLRAGIFGTIFAGDHDKKAPFGDRLGYMYQVSAGKYFNPYIALRANLSYGIFKGASGWTGHSLSSPMHSFNYQGYIIRENNILTTNSPYTGYPVYKTLQEYMSIGLDGMFSLWKQGEHFYRPSLVVGMTYLHTLNKDVRKESSSEMSANIGINNAFRLSKRFTLELEATFGYVSDSFDGEYSGAVTPQAGHWGEGYMYLGLGLSYSL